MRITLRKLPPTELSAAIIPKPGRPDVALERLTGPLTRAIVIRAVSCNTDRSTAKVTDGSSEPLPEESHYRGHRLSDLQVDEVAWSERSADHIGTRTQRYLDHVDELDIEPEWASEAALDVYGQLGLTRENDLRVLGWSPHAPAASWSKRSGRVLRVVLKPVDIDLGSWTGVTAMPASENAASHYWRRRRSYGAA